MAFSDARKERGLYLAEVLRNERVSPHMVRLTLGGEDLARLPQHGFDHWVRLFFPHPEHGTPDFSHLPETFGLTGYVRYLTQRSGTRPAVRSYTIREHRGGEVDIDFVSHGDDSLAGPWAAKAEPGERVAMIDQGCGFDLRPDADFQLLVGDESAMPAVLGILRDLPGEAKGLAIIEVPDPDDAQEVVGPDGVEVRWIVREDRHARPGEAALAELRGFTPVRPETISAFLVGEQQLAAEGRRHLVACGVPKARIEFSGFWRVGRAAD